MPAQDFSVHLDPDDLNLAAIRSPQPSRSERRAPAGGEATHHGAHDGRQAARQRSGRDRSGRAAGSGSGRSYAFRRS